MRVISLAAAGLLLAVAACGGEKKAPETRCGGLGRRGSHPVGPAGNDRDRHHG